MTPTGEDLFVVVVHRGARQQRLTTGWASAAARAVAHLRSCSTPPVAADWMLRADIHHPHPVLLGTLGDGGIAHVTCLIPGKPVTAHPETCCGTLIEWDSVTVCELDLRRPCPGCLTVVREMRS
ncbi:MAG: hypothetical protein ACRDQJ_18890 [Pseudonocardiaceae bacterium]